MEFALELNCEPVGRWCGPVVDNKESLSHRFPRLDDPLRCHVCFSSMDLLTVQILNSYDQVQSNKILQNLKNIRKRSKSNRYEMYV